MDLISVIMPFYKKKKFFKDSLLSVINQTYKKLEIIIIYDDIISEDLKFVTNLSKLDNRITVLNNKKNLGVAASRNIGMSRAQGQYFAFLDCDDIWKKEKINIQYNFMIKHKLEFSHTSYEIINYRDDLIGIMRVKKELFYKDLLNSCDIGLSTVMMKKNLIQISNFKNINTKEDYALWLEYSRKNINIIGIDEILTSWRKLKNSLSNSIIDKFKNAFKVYYVFEKKNLIISFFLVINLAIFYIVKKIKQLKKI